MQSELEKQKKDAPLLRDPEIYPSNEVLKDVLGKSYSAFEMLMKEITSEKFGLTPEWRYYKDGHAWLCKVVHKKKTVFWLSVWDKLFKAAFYFTEKTGDGLSKLDLKKETLDNFKGSKPIGKLLPLTFQLTNKNQVQEVLKVAEYKKGLK